MKLFIFKVKKKWQPNLVFRQRRCRIADQRAIKPGQSKLGQTLAVNMDSEWAGLWLKEE